MTKAILTGIAECGLTALGLSGVIYALKQDWADFKELERRERGEDE